MIPPPMKMLLITLIGAGDLIKLPAGLIESITNKFKIRTGPPAKTTHSECEIINIAIINMIACECVHYKTTK